MCLKLNTTYVYGIKYFVVCMDICVICGYLVQLEDTFREDAEKTLQETPGREDYRQAWDDAQREVRINKLISFCTNISTRMYSKCCHQLV